MIAAPCQSGDRIAITGVTGRVGRAVLASLRLKGGYEARGLVRSPDHGLPIAAHMGHMDMADFRPFLRGCAGLVHCAFAHVPGRYRGGEGDDPEAFWNLNVNGTIRLLEQAREVGVRRVILFSSRAVYANSKFDPGELIDGSFLPCPDTHYGLQKMAIEGLARLYSNEAMSVAVLRPTGIYDGDPETSKWRDLFFDAAQGVFPKINRTSTEVPAVMVGNAAVGLLAAEHPGVPGGVFNLSDVRVSFSGILAVAGFDISAMSPPEPMQGPELDRSDLRKLIGLGHTYGMTYLKQEAKRLRKGLGL